MAELILLFIMVVCAFYFGVMRTNDKWTKAAGCKTPVKHYGSMYYVCEKKQEEVDYGLRPK